MAIVEGEHDGVGWSLFPAMLALDADGADHGRTFII
jgi:hypothetical protein